MLTYLLTHVLIYVHIYIYSGPESPNGVKIHKYHLEANAFVVFGAVVLRVTNPSPKPFEEAVFLCCVLVGVLPQSTDLEDLSQTGADNDCVLFCVYCGRPCLIIIE